MKFSTIYKSLFLVLGLGLVSCESESMDDQNEDSKTDYSTYNYVFFSGRGRHTRLTCDWSSDVCSSDLAGVQEVPRGDVHDVAGMDGAAATGDGRSSWLAVSVSDTRPPVHSGPPSSTTWKNAGVGLSDRKSTRLNSSHMSISYAVFCLKK